MNHTQTDYGNWIPLAMMRRLAVLIGALLLGTALLFLLLPTPVPGILLGIAAAALLAAWLYMFRCRRLFDFSGGNLMGTLHQYLAEHLTWDGQGTLLDIGCGAGALTIRCARRFPLAHLVGMDSWGPEWSYAQEQCRRNAALEGVAERVKFEKGDAARLACPDGAFDAVVSNFVFHEVRTEPDKRKVVREALRVLKKGGAFAFQDLFSQEALYGDMEQFAQELRREGFQEVVFIPHVERLGFVPRFVQAPGMLCGVGLLFGKK